MIHLTQNIASETFVVTLNELKTLSNPYFLFIFTHVTTKQQVAKIFAPENDLSSYTDRYNKYAIPTSTLFSGKPVGEWHYVAYEQESSVNTDPDLATGTVEYGKMYLNEPAADVFEYEKYNTATSFKTYES